MNKSTQFTVLSTILFFSFNSYSQLTQFGNTNAGVLSDTTTCGFYFFNQPNSVQEGECFLNYKQITNDIDNSFEMIKKWDDSTLHLTHVKYQQYYKNVKVEAAEFTEHFDGDKIVFSNGKFGVDFGDIVVKPSITKEAAFESLLNYLDEDNIYAWQDTTYENQIKSDLGSTTATFYPEGKLLLALDNYNNLPHHISGDRYTLAYEFTVLSIQPYFNKKFFINASNGDVIKSYSVDIHDGPADVVGHGTQTIDTRFKGGFTQAFALHTNDNNRNIHTKYYSNFAWSVTQNITDGDDIWGSSEIGGTTTHWLVSETWDFFVNKFQRLGFDDQGAEIRVQTDATFNQASWSFQGGKNYLTFGLNSNGVSYYGRSSDVIGHEYFHGINGYTAGLQGPGEPGALNESFADIFGTLVDYEINGQLDWILGDDINLNQRSMSDPNSSGSHFIFDNQMNCIENSGQPDTYNGINWQASNVTCDAGGVHVNSGVQNYWFYLLSTGGVGNNDIGNYFIVNPIGTEKAGEIAYYNLTNILQSGSQYEEARMGAITAAKLLYGDCSYEHINTQNAWYAVGLGSESECIGSNLSEENLIEVNVFPNPTSDFVNIEYYSGENASINLYNSVGQILQNKVSKDRAIIDLSNYSNGIYFIEVNIYGTKKVFKIIKNK